MNKTEIMAQAIKLRKFIETNALDLTDDEAYEMPLAFPAWETDTEYKIGDRVQYNAKLYKCVQAHTSQSDWTPDATPALWTEVAKPGEIPEWKQPTGAQDAYNKGDKVRHNDLVWESDVNANVWEPGVYGWSQVQ